MSETFKNWTRCECGVNVPPNKECPVCNQNGRKKAGVVLDKYKFPIFSQILSKHGFEFVLVGDFTHDTFALTVVTDDLDKLKSVLEICQKRCQFLNQN